MFEELLEAVSDSLEEKLWFVIADFEEEEDADELAEKERAEVLRDPLTNTFKVIIFNDDPETQELWGDGESWRELADFENEEEARAFAEEKRSEVFLDQSAGVFRVVIGQG